MRAPLLALGLLGLMVSTVAAQEVGVTAAVNQSALGIAPGQAPKTMYLGDKIIHDQKITTNAKGLLQILLADGTSFTVGPNSTMTIDSFVYDPSAGTAKVVADLGTGLFRFIGGKSSKSDGGVTLNTPVGTVGIRGGITNLDFSGATASHIDMVYGVGVTLKDGTQVIGDIYHSGYSIVIGNGGKIGIEKTPPEWSAAFQTAMTGHGTGGGVTGTKVAGLGGTNKTSSTSSGNDQSNSNSDVASNQSPITTWAQIGSNADLATAYGTYNGTYSATVSGSPSHEFHDGQQITDAAFQLDYYFADRTGTAYFGEPNHTNHLTSDPALAIDVIGSTGQGDALLSADPSQTGHPYDAQQGTGSATLNGYFLNTNGQVAGGVAGTFTGSVVGGEDGSYTLTGAFGGNLTGTSPTPPSF